MVYGINTGFGKLAQTTIAKDHLAELQRNLVLSHSVGLGKPLPDDVVNAFYGDVSRRAPSRVADTPRSPRKGRAAKSLMKKRRG